MILRFPRLSLRPAACILWGLLAFGALRAQEPPLLRDVRVRVLSWSGTIEGVMLRSGPGPEAEWLPVRAVDYVRSPFFEVSSGPDLIFFRWQELEDGTRIPVEDGRVRIEGMGDTVLVLISQGETGRRYQALAEGLEDFPAGGYRFLNVSRRNLVVGAGGERELLASGRSLTLVPEVEKDSVGVLVQLAGLVDGEARLVYSNRLARRDGQRLLFFVADAQRGRMPVEVKRIMESTRSIQPPPPPSPPPGS